MPRYVKIASQLPEEVHRRYAELDHGQKQLACTAGFLLYFERDEDTQWIYREWAKAIAEERADMSNPPPSLRKLMPKKRTASKKRNR